MLEVSCFPHQVHNRCGYLLYEKCFIVVQQHVCKLVINVSFSGIFVLLLEYIVPDFCSQLMWNIGLSALLFRPSCRSSMVMFSNNFFLACFPFVCHSHTSFISLPFSISLCLQTYFFLYLHQRSISLLENLVSMRFIPYFFMFLLLHLSFIGDSLADVTRLFFPCFKNLWVPLEVHFECKSYPVFF